MVRFLSLLIAFVVVALALPAHAQTSRLYFAGYMGLVMPSEQDFTESSAPISGDIEFKNGLSLAGALGVRLSRQVRLEGEFAYSTTDLDRVDFDNAGSFEMGGELRSWVGMMNVYYDFETPWAIEPFIGGGLGFGLFEGTIEDGSGLAPDSSDDTTALTWQMGGGLKYRINPDLAFSSAYRYLGATSLDLGTYEMDYSGHEFRIGLEYDLPVGGE